MTKRMINPLPTLRFAIFVLLATALIGHFGSTPSVLASGFLQVPKNDGGTFDPQAGPLRIRYQLDADANKVEAIFQDSQGKVINRLYFARLNAGDHDISWDGNNSNDQPVPPGKYRCIIQADFSEGGTGTEVVEFQVITATPQPGAQLPEPLPAPEYPYTITGSAGTFVRHNSDNAPETEGEMHLRTVVTYERDETRARGVFSVIQDFESGETIADGTYGSVTQRWQGGKAKALYRDNLGYFDDPMQLFNDYKTDRDKLGVQAEQSFGKIHVQTVAFATDGSGDTEQQGAAARLTYATSSGVRIGASYTLRQGDDLEDFEDEEDAEDDNSTAQAAAFDITLPVLQNFSVIMEGAGSSDDNDETGTGYLLRGDYSQGPFRLYSGYIDLAENFRAPFADPLSGVSGNARGLEAGADMYLTQTYGFIKNPAITVRFYQVTQYSDDTNLSEIDGSLRFGIGHADTIYLSLYNQESEYGSSLSTLGSISHKWNEIWNSRFQVNYTGTDSSDTIRTTLSTSYKKGLETARLSMEWLNRTIDYSKYSPYSETTVRLDLSNGLWSLQLLGQYNKDKENDGVNGFARLEYAPLFLHRYNILTYCAVGNRSSFEFETQFEVGLEVTF